MSGSSLPSEQNPFLTTVPVFPLLCGMEFLARPVRLSKQSQHDFGLFADMGRLNNWQFDRQRIQLFLQNPAHALIVTDCKQAIQFVNQGFLAMTGYSRKEVLNRAPAFLQGANTSAATKSAIRECLAAERPFSGDILNYRKNQKPYWCRIDIEPVRNHKTEITHYVAFEREAEQAANRLDLR